MIVNPRTGRQVKIGSKIYRELVRDGDIRAPQEANDLEELDRELGPCPPNTVRNPKTLRCIKVNGKVYKDLKDKGMLPQQRRSPPRPQPQQRPQQQPIINDGCPEGTILNPQTKRCIKLTGKLFKELQKKGVFNVVPVPVRRRSPEQQRRSPVKRCPQGQVLNPDTKRCIKKGGELYKKLLKRGVIFHDDDIVPKKKTPEKKKKTSKKKKTRTCNNAETFMLFTDVNDIDEDDLIVTPSGYCFSITEILEWIKSGNYTNINPHVQTEALFDTLDGIKNPALITALSTYFAAQRSKRDVEAGVIARNIDTFYLIGRAGGICYFDQLHNFEEQDSSAFEASIEALSDLMTAIEELPSKEARAIFLGLKTYGDIPLANTIKAANEGTLCIHGVGTSLLSIFVRNYLSTEKKEPQAMQPYAPLKTGVYFFIEKNGRINFASMNSRQTIKPNTYYHKGISDKFNITAADIKDSTLFWNAKKMKQDSALDKAFQDACLNGPDIASMELHDQWSMVSDWRKMKLGDGYCFDLLFLIHAMTAKLNTVKHINPYPGYPMNPFTSKPIAMKDLKAIRRRIKQNYLIVAKPLQIFLANPEKLWSEDTTYVTSDRWRNMCITLFEKDMRYVREFESFNQADGDLNIVGFWDKTDKPLSSNERTILAYIDTMDIRKYGPTFRTMAPYDMNANSYYVRSSAFDNAEIVYERI